MSEPTGLRAARQGQIILRPVPGSPRIFRRNRDVPRLRQVFDYALTSARYGSWPRPTTAPAVDVVVGAILDDAEEVVAERGTYLLGT